MQEQVNSTIKKASQTATKAARRIKENVEDTVGDVEAATDSPEPTLDGVFGGLKSTLASFDQSPLAFIKANPVRATFIGFFIGLIFGAAMSKRSVTK